MHKFKEHKEHSKRVLFLESEQTKTPKIEHIEDVLFGKGVVGAKQILRVLNSLKERLSGTELATREDILSISENLMKASRLLSDINTLTLNRISTSDTLKNQFKTYTAIKRNKLTEPNLTNAFVKWVEQTLNSNILKTKRTPTIYKRQAEKTEILRFYRNNAKDIPLIFEFLSLVLEAKKLISQKMKNVKDDDLLVKESFIDFIEPIPQGSK
jgi:hypothetical protein